MIRNRTHRSKPSIRAKPSEEHKVITPRQSGAIIASTLLGVGILTLPRVLADQVREAAWLATILGGLVTLLFFVIISRLSYRFPLKSIAAYAPEIMSPKRGPRWIGKGMAFLIITGLIIYWLGTIAVIARSFGEMMSSAVLPHTPIEVIIITILILSFLLTLYEIEVVARVNELVLPFIVVPLLLIILLSIQSFRMEHFLPLWPDLNIKELFAGVMLGVFAYIGYEVVMVFGGYTLVTRHTLPINLFSYALPVFIYTIVVIITIGSFGIHELSNILWPTYELIKVTEVPGVIFERLEAFLAVWMAAVFTTAANLLYAASFLAKKMMSRGQTYLYAFLFLPFIYWLSLRPQSIYELFRYQALIGYGALIFGGAVPILLFLLARRRGIGQPPSHQLDDDV